MVAAPAAKRMKVASSDDVSSRVQPQLAGQAEPAPQTGTAGAPQAEDASGPAAASSAGQPAALHVRQLGTGSYRRCELPPSHYVLTLEQLQEHGYPLPQVGE